MDRASAEQVGAIRAMEDTVLALAVEIAEAVIGREMEAAAPAIARIAAERSLALMPHGRAAVLAVHPDVSPCSGRWTT